MRHRNNQQLPKKFCVRVMYFRSKLKSSVVNFLKRSIKSIIIVVCVLVHPRQLTTYFREIGSVCEAKGYNLKHALFKIIPSF